MTAVARDSRNKKGGTACWQLLGERNGKRLLHKLGIGRTGKRVVIILFVLNARRLQAEFVQLRPRFLVGVAADDRKNCGTQIGCQRRWVCDIFCETFATTRDNFGII